MSVQFIKNRNLNEKHTLTYRPSWDSADNFGSWYVNMGPIHSGFRAVNI
jgi:hypothetical protein